MFSYESPRSDAPRTLFQLFAVPLCLLITGSCAFGLVELVTFQRLPEAMVGYLIFSGVGFGSGLLVQSRIPDAIEFGGRWVWVLPALLMSWGLVDDWIYFGRREVLLDFAGGQGDAEWTLFFLVLPCLACGFYSLGMVLAYRKERRSR